MKIRVLVFAALMLLIAGCAEMMSILQTTVTIPLTEADVVNGLKEALITGARNSAQKLSAENGYFGDAAIKIALPDDCR
jgi:uncharacterized lipoprotein YajG